MAKRPAPKGPQKKYRNAGVTTLHIGGEVLEPDAEFLATLDPDFEAQMLAGGHLELLEDQSLAADQAQADAADESARPAGPVPEPEAANEMIDNAAADADRETKNSARRTTRSR